VIVSVHIADVGLRAAANVLRSCPDSAAVPGLRYAETMIAAPLASGRVATARRGRVGLIAAWDDDAALERFLGDHPVATPLSPGWHVRLEPVRAWGAWSGLPDLPAHERAIPDQPVAVLTLGRLRLARVRSFLATSARTEREAVAHPALLAATGLARPPRLVATFSLWRSIREMREYAVGTRPGTHLQAIRAHQQRPFHHESAFVRFRPYATHGTWDGRDPLMGPGSNSTATTAQP
jgi:hypothetical protein